MKIIIKYSDDHIKIKFLNNINYKIKSDLSKICDITTLEYKREKNEKSIFLDRNCNVIAWVYYNLVLKCCKKEEKKRKHKERAIKKNWKIFK